MRPDLNLIANWCHPYIAQVQETDLADAFAANGEKFLSFFENIPAEKHNYRYAPGKWTIKEVIQHIVDTERIFAYRALRFARQDRTRLHGFDENLFADNAKAHTRPWLTLLEEFKVVRKSSELLFLSFDQTQLESKGYANDSPTYVLGIAYTLIGHSLHHLSVTKERYF